MARIPDDEINRFKNEIDLVALIQSKGVELKKHGVKDLVGKCPFHQDDTASLIVTPAKNLWHCMGCGKGGSVFDFVMAYEGVSFRHAYELLSNGGLKTLMRSGRPVKLSLVRKLESPIDVDADEPTTMRQVMEYYHQRLKQSPVALEYLRNRGITDEAIDHFKIGFADRTLGLRVPIQATVAGAEIQTRLKKLGILRAESGHEHFNGSVVFPIHDENGTITEMYARKIRDDLREGTAYHLYLPGTHVGIFNRRRLFSGDGVPPPREIILCESIIDALTFWCAGFRNATCIYGTEGFTEELWEAFLRAKTERIYVAYDADAAGDRATGRDAPKFIAKGIECFRIRFPVGMDANEYARKVTPPDKSLGVLLHSAEWLGKGKPLLNGTPSPEANGVHVAESLSRVHAPTPSSLAALLAAKEKNVVPLVSVDQPSATSPTLQGSAAHREELPIQQNGDDIQIMLQDRQWRIRGLDKNVSTDVLRVNLRLMVNELYYVNVIDMYQAKARMQFINEASKETLLDPELIKRDMGKLLLKLEMLQSQRLTQTEKNGKEQADKYKMTPEEKTEAEEFLKNKNLVQRIMDVLGKSGLVGEKKNALVAYLAGTSRKLERPLAIIIQSTSAAGKSTLMDSILSLFPEEERIKYSAMTGQSLYYLGEKDLKHKILAIVEEEGAEKASYALKLLQSEGELRIASTGKDVATGRMVTQEYTVEGPVMIILTTTAIELDEELQNRAVVLTVDESKEQTALIHAMQRKSRTLEGLIAKDERKHWMQVLRNAQRLLEAVPLVNPYAEELTFTNEQTRNRRDNEKYLTLIDAIALLHQHQRERKPVIRPHQSGQTHYIEVTLEDIEIANDLAPELFARSLDELPPQTRRLLEAIKVLVKEKCDGHKQMQRHCLFSRRELRQRIGWSTTQIRVHMDRLRDLEYVAVRCGRNGSMLEYELLVDCREPEGVTHIGLIDVAELRRRKSEKT